MGAVVLYHKLKALSKKSVSIYIFDQPVDQICIQKLSSKCIFFNWPSAWPVNWPAGWPKLKNR